MPVAIKKREASAQDAKTRTFKDRGLCTALTRNFKSDVSLYVSNNKEHDGDTYDVRYMHAIASRIVATIEERYKVADAKGNDKEFPKQDAYTSVELA